MRYPPNIHKNVIGDPGRIRQVITNLLGNAIKFTNEGSVLLNVEEIADEGIDDNKVKFKISITDTGIGIPKEVQETIFDKFSQADSSTTRKFGGTGLGLAICKQLSEMMDGEIAVESKENKGSTFWFTIVLEKGENIKPSDYNIENLKNLKALVIDDMKINQTLLKEQLKHAKMKCDVCTNHNEALDLLYKAQEANKPYDIALIDYLMPDLNGEQAAYEIRSKKEFKEMCFVMLSSANITTQPNKFKETGFRGYLPKPIKNTQMLKALSIIWSKHSSNEGDFFVTIEDTLLHKNDNQTSIKFDDVSILLTEDNRVNQAFATELLEGLGCKVNIASNGVEAIQSLEKHSIDIILMDVNMPEMDGYETTKEIRKIEKKKKLDNTPIIALTANAMKGDKEKCIKAGMDDYISKPIRKDDLRNVISKWAKA